MSDIVKTAKRVRQLMEQGYSREYATKVAASEEAPPSSAGSTLPPPTPVDGKVHLPIMMGGSAKDRKAWWEVLPPEQADAKFDENWNMIGELERYVTNPDRPLNVLVFTCSGRNKKLSCAHEDARSYTAAQGVLSMLKKYGFNEVTYYDLWDLNIEHCNGCYGTEDYWCHWPCTCWPFDDMQIIYRAVVKADAIVIISPTNEAAAASRFHAMWHRCISLDGGFAFKPPPGWQKSEENLQRMRAEYGEASGVGVANGRGFIQRFNGKPFGVVILGHELGAQVAAGQIQASIQFKGGYVPSGGLVSKIYAGAGPTAIDKQVMSTKNHFTEELAEQLREMCESLAIEAKTNRTKPKVETRLQRA